MYILHKVSAKSDKQYQKYLAGIDQLVEQQTVMQQVPGSIHTQPGWRLTQLSIPLWVGKMSTSKNIG